MKTQKWTLEDLIVHSEVRDTAGRWAVRIIVTLAANGIMFMLTPKQYQLRDGFFIAAVQFIVFISQCLSKQWNDRHRRMRNIPDDALDGDTYLSHCLSFISITLFACALFYCLGYCLHITLPRSIRLIVCTALLFSLLTYREAISISHPRTIEVTDTELRFLTYGTVCVTCPPILMSGYKIQQKYRTYYEETIIPLESIIDFSYRPESRRLRIIGDAHIISHYLNADGSIDTDYPHQDILLSDTDRRPAFHDICAYEIDQRYISQDIGSEIFDFLNNHPLVHRFD